MKKIMLSLACMFVLLIDCHLHAMHDPKVLSDSERWLLDERDSRRFGELPNTAITPEERAKLARFRRGVWPDVDYGYPVNRQIVAKGLREQYEGWDQEFKDDALYQAVRLRDYYLADYALEYGANPNSNDVIFIAQSIDIVKLLIAKGALLDARPYRDNFNLLHITAHDDSYESAVLEYYIQNAKIPINSLTRDQETPLHIFATSNGLIYHPYDNIANLLAKLNLLLNAGVDCQRKDIRGQTALDIVNKRAAAFPPNYNDIFDTVKTIISKKMRADAEGCSIGSRFATKV